MILLAYRPFIDPLPIHGSGWWVLLLLPLVVLVSVGYKAIKLHDLRELPRQAAMLSIQIFAFMAAAAVSLWLLTVLA